MPLYDDEIQFNSSNSVASLPSSAETAPEQEPESGFLETAKAFTALENPVFGATKELLLPSVSQQFAPDFRPIDRLQNDRPDLIEYVGNFTKVKNEEEFNRKVFNIDYENDQRDIIRKAPVLTMIAAGLAEGVIDPITLIPLFKAYKSASLTGRLIKGATTGVAYGAGTGLTQEAILRSVSETRTDEESMMNIAVSSIAGSFFGAGVSAFSKPVVHDAAKILLKDAIGLEDVKFIVDIGDDDLLPNILRQEAIEVEANKLNKIVGANAEIDTKAVVSLPGNATIRIALDSVAQARIDKGLSPVVKTEGFKEHLDVLVDAQIISINKKGKTKHNVMKLKSMLLEALPNDIRRTSKGSISTYNKDIKQYLIDLPPDSPLRPILVSYVEVMKAKNYHSKISDGIRLEGATGKVNVEPTTPINPLELETMGDFNADHSIGAGEFKSADALGLAHLNENLTKFISGPEGLRAPELRAILSPSLSVKKLGAVFYDSNLIRNGNKDGIAYTYNAEKEIIRDTNNTMSIVNEVNKLYTKYTGHGQIASSFESLRGKDKIGYSAFNKKIFSNLIDDTRVDDILEVNAASKPLRDAMDNRMKELSDAGIFKFKKDVDGNLQDINVYKNHLAKRFDLDKLSIPENRLALKNTVKTWLHEHLPSGEVRKNKLDPDKLDSMSDDYVDKIMGESDTITMKSVTEDIISSGKFSVSDQIMIPANLVQDFLVDDAVGSFSQFMSGTSKLLASHKALKEAGFSSIEEAKSAILKEGDAMTRGLSNDTDKIKTYAKYKKEAKMADKMYRSVLGQLRKPHWSDAVALNALKYQYIRLGGGMVLSSLQEIFMPLFRKGVIPTLRDGWLPMLRDFNAVKLAKHEWQDIIGSLDIQNSGALKTISGLEDPDRILKDMSKFDIFMSTASTAMGKLSGLADWTDFGFGNAARIATASLTRKLLKGVKESDIEILASMGLNKNMIPRVTDQLTKYSKNVHGSYLSNFNLWKDKEALMAFKNAIQTDTTSMMIRPGIGTQPFFVQESNIARVIWQFKSFSQAATCKITISGLQRRDAKVLIGAVALVIAGGFKKMAQDKMAGKDIDYDIDTFIANGLSQSGLMGLWMTSAMDLGRGLMDPKKRRYEGQNLTSTILGPTGGQIYQVGDTLGRISDGDVSEKDRKAALKMIPFNNLFYMNLLMDKVFGDDD